MADTWANDSASVGGPAAGLIGIERARLGGTPTAAWHGKKVEGAALQTERGQTGFLSGYGMDMEMEIGGGGKPGRREILNTEYGGERVNNFTEYGENMWNTEYLYG